VDAEEIQDAIDVLAIRRDTLLRLDEEDRILVYAAIRDSESAVPTWVRNTLAVTLQCAYRCHAARVRYAAAGGVVRRQREAWECDEEAYTHHGAENENGQIQGAIAPEGMHEEPAEQDVDSYDNDAQVGFVDECEPEHFQYPVLGDENRATGEHSPETQLEETVPGEEQKDEEDIPGSRLHPLRVAALEALEAADHADHEELVAVQRAIEAEKQLAELRKDDEFMGEDAAERDAELLLVDGGRAEQRVASARESVTIPSETGVQARAQSARSDASSADRATQDAITHGTQDGAGPVDEIVKEELDEKDMALRVEAFRAEAERAR